MGPRIGWFLLLAAGAGSFIAVGPAVAAGGAAATASETLVEAEAPPFSEGIFPCSSCHGDLPKNGERRELAFHDEQQSIFSHDAEHRWCLDCHDLENRDVLHLTSGAKVKFSESYLLCGQCHGDKLRDWRLGIHGKRVGRWDGAKTYFLCVNCHNPHAPRFKGVAEVVVDGKPTVAPTQEFLKPEPRPRRPEEQRQ
ncbi:MAG TPA: hypothetical protein VFG53_09240 [Anaeromyxobacter sp.]|nr:hypothetical protein [Anaeromyxobacter sp.]